MRLSTARLSKERFITVKKTQEKMQIQVGLPPRRLVFIYFLGRAFNLLIITFQRKSLRPIGPVIPSSAIFASWAALPGLRIHFGGE
jgi:hypothetical protein